MTSLEKHYAAPDLARRIAESLGAIGLSPESVSIDDLAPIDEFHLVGAAATSELCGLLDVGEDDHVLDVGAGIGGPARRLAQASGCRVTGIDLSADYCSAGNELSRWVGLADRVKLEVGDATSLDRYEAATFDAAWTIHVGMNIVDKTTLYAEVERVLAPGASFVIYDILSSGAGDIHFPVPWAAMPEQSSLATLEEMLDHLATAGFSIDDKFDRTPASLDFLDTNAARIKELGGPPPVGLHVIVGPAIKERITQVRRNLAEGLVAPTIIHARKS